MTSADAYTRPAIAGSGTIASGLAACASVRGPVILLARSEESAARASALVERAGAKLDGADPGNVTVTTRVEELAGCDLAVESIAEEPEPKVELLRRLGEACPEADLATTTSSLSVGDLGRRSGNPERTFGLHPFNPVARMELIELCIPQGASEEILPRARAWCEAIGKTAVEVPDEAGFVVNRLLFPYLFDAVRLLEQTGMPPEDVDRCMTLGAGYPMGPLALLDLVGIDVAIAIGEALHAETDEPHHRPPGRLIALAGERRLGRKTGTGFFDYAG